MSGAYGYCPRCGGLGISRERRLNGNDRCENGHGYPSLSAVANPLLPVAPERAAENERAAVVAWLLRNHYDDTAERIERGEHRRGEGK